MQVEREQFEPPRPKGWSRAIVLALLAHALLIAALTLGVHWKRDTPPVKVMAELWSSIPTAAAPKAGKNKSIALTEEAEPAPKHATPSPPRADSSLLRPLPTPNATPPPLIQPTEAEIRLAREKMRDRREAEQLGREVGAARHDIMTDAARRDERLSKTTEAKTAEEETTDKPKKKPAASAKKDKTEAPDTDTLPAKTKKSKEPTKELDKEKDTKLAKSKTAKDKETPTEPTKDSARDDPAKREALKESQREEAKRRTQAMAGKPDDEEDDVDGRQGLSKDGGNGASAKSSAPSAGYAARVAARIKSNISFADDIDSYDGNPRAEVLVKTAPNGAIIGKNLVRSSGVRSWDNAVLRAIDKTEVIPRDGDGRVPGEFIIILSMKEQ